MQQQLENLRTAADWLCVAAQKVVLYLDRGDGEQVEDDEVERELERIRAMAMENARQEVALRNSTEALDRTRERLAQLPDLDIDKEYQKILSEVDRQKPSDDATLRSLPQFIKLEEVIKEAFIDRKKEEEERAREAEREEAGGGDEEEVVNKLCGHRYKKAWIMQQLEQKGKVRCPERDCRINDLRKEDLMPPPDANTRRTRGKKVTEIARTGN